MDIQVLQTLAIAADLHDGQVDKAGRPYIGHLIRVARNVAEMQTHMGREDGEVLQAAILHDAFEDQRERYALIEPVLPARVRRIVRALSRADSESYDAFIARIAADSIDAVLIKLADLQDNLDPGRRAMLPEADRAPPAKYLEAREWLLQGMMHHDWPRPPMTATQAIAGNL